ncbi:hypothetical protein D3C80_785810 [compost metagenome]
MLHLGHGCQRPQLQAGQPGRNRQAGTGRAIGDQQLRGAVLEQVGQALAGVVQVQRHIGAAGLEHRQQADQQTGAAWQRNCHPHFRADAGGDQPVGQGVAAPVQLGIAQGLPGAAQGQGLRLLASQAFDTLVHPLRRGRFDRQRLRRRHRQAKLAQALVGAVAQALQQAFHGGADGQHGLVLEAATQVHVLDRQAPLFHGDHQVHGEVGQAAARTRAELQGGVAELAQSLIHRLVLEHDDAVEQRPPGLPGPALDVGQGHVLVIAHAQVAVLQLAQPSTDMGLGV